ncbi:hypothetical protein OpiT1DRAFT_02682 [Opitutaceae bacterium TAV1]|nr:hypothetical protein OpiT1DRAFT_02682 [Opitutaceae bacterium TAV1]
MPQKPSPTTRAPSRRPTRPASAVATGEAFDEIVGLIQAARERTFQAVNTALIDLYWNVGHYISHKLATAEWGEGTIPRLAAHIARRHPDIKGFTRSNLFRARQFYETYKNDSIVATLSRQLPWSHNLLILARSRRSDEREFYLRMAARERWSYRELQRQLNGALFERTVLSPPKASPALTRTHPDALSLFKDTYLLDFLNLPDNHDETDLHRGLVKNLRRFLTELGRDFCYIGSEHRLQVGGTDFFIDLLFFHRGLNALVAIDLKIEDFQPAHMGQLEFYLEALDRDVRKSHEKPSIGLLLCATKDDEVVEYALARSHSPALVAEYELQLPDKKYLRAKLHEFYQLAAARSRPDHSANPA